VKKKKEKEEGTDGHFSLGQRQKQAAATLPNRDAEGEVNEGYFAKLCEKAL